MRYFNKIVLLFALAGAMPAAAEEVVEYQVDLYGSGATGHFAPYYIGSLTHGKYAQKASALLDARAVRPMSLQSRLSWGYGAEILAGYTSKNDYARWDAHSHTWEQHSAGLSAAWLQQLYAEVKFRGVFLKAGMKEHASALLCQQLSSGDLVESGNARPVPEARIGFVDFQNIPFTQGWVQIQGEISYGKMMDNGWLKQHYNYYNYHIALGSYFTYKRCYFRTNPSQPLSVTAGMQTSGFYGGETQYFEHGKLVKIDQHSSSIKTMLKMFLPMGENGEDYYVGSTLGSWDFHARYLLRNGDKICAYFQWPWEDGSSIGRTNGWDGLWGLEYEAADESYLDGLVVEYLDFRHQCGPVHWSPDDSPGTTIHHSITGRDNYYNNFYYNAFANYGMSMGTPALLSPIYNLDGYLAFKCNRMQGVHVGAMGSLLPSLRYRLLGGYQRGLGTYNVPYASPHHDFSLMVEAVWQGDVWLPGLKVRAQIGVDRGSLRGNNFGTAVAISYTGDFKL